MSKKDKLKYQKKILLLYKFHSFLRFFLILFIILVSVLIFSNFVQRVQAQQPTSNQYEAWLDLWDEFWKRWNAYVSSPPYEEHSRSVNGDIVYKCKPKPLVGEDQGTLAWGLAGFNYDFICRCPKDHCRLSVIRDWGDRLRGQGWDSLFTCIKGATNPQEAFFLPEKFSDNDPEVNFLKHFKVTNLYDEVNFDASLLDQVGSITYMDQFSFDPVRSSVPIGSYCRLDPKTGTAYWYYSGFAKDVTRNPDRFLASSLCNDPLFASKDLFGNTVTGTQTFFGCLPNSTNGLVAFLVRLLTGLSVFITLLIIFVNLIIAMSNVTDSSEIQQSQERIRTAVMVLIGIFFAMFLLEVIGIQILGLGGGLLNLFLGGE